MNSNLCPYGYNILENTVVSESKPKGWLSQTAFVLLVIFWAQAAYVYRLATASLTMSGSLVKINAKLSQSLIDNLLS